MSDDKSADMEMIVGFIDEAQDDLYSVVQNFMDLRTNGYDEATVQSLFRVFHSIKGNSAYFNLTQIKELSHAIEQVMEGIRQKKLPITDDVIAILIDGANGVSKGFEVVRAEGAQAKIPQAVDNAKNEILKFLGKGSGQGGGDSTETLKEVINDLTAIQEGTSAAADVIKKYEEKLEKLDIASKKSALNNNPNMPKEYKELEELMLDETVYPAGHKIFATIKVLVETLKQYAEDTEDTNKTIKEMIDDLDISEKTIGLDPLIKNTVLDQMAKLKIVVPKEGGGEGQQHKEGAPSGEQDNKNPAGAAAAAAPAAKTMRISEDSVDNFLAYVGELVIVEDMYMNLGTMASLANHARKEDVIIELKKITETFSQLSRNLQKSIMEIRKVPIDQIFKRMPKIINEVAAKENKKINVKIEGGDLRIDKTILEILESPLVHMTRNAADHGIEKPTDRIAAGKNEEGTITLGATEKSGIVIVTISDDGGGLNLPKLREKAVQLGIMDAHEPFDQEKIINVMFASGVSTSEVVTDISGRGVGMDVVKKNLEKANGQIATHTETGKGTTFVLTIPSVMTTQIMQGFVVKTETDRFILPLESIEASMSVGESKIESVNEKGHVVQFKEGVIPLQRLSEAIDPVGAEFSADPKEIIVVLHNKNVFQAYVVSAVVGIHQIVKKELTLPSEFAANISGSAIMGDGVVSLLLDVDALFGVTED